MSTQMPVANGPGANQDPYFTVVIPTYNRGSLLPRAIDSVLGQTFTRFEVIVVDDGSTDNTAEVMAGYSDPRVRYIRIDHGGTGAARNAGGQAARGVWLVFLDSDDEALPNWLATAHVAVRDDTLDVLCCALRTVDANGQGVGVRMPSNHGPLFDNLEVNFLAGALFMRTTLFHAIGGYRPELSYGENFEMGVRIAAHIRNAPERIRCTRDVLVDVYEHDGMRGSDLSPAKFESLERFIELHEVRLAEMPAELAKSHRWAAVAALGIEDYDAARRHLQACMRSGAVDWKDWLRYLLTVPGLRWANRYRHH